MTLLDPTRLVWGLLAIPLILLAVVQRRARHVVSSGLVWDAVLAERTWFERARRPILLALRVAVLELLVFAAADPRLRSTEADVLVVVVDVSAGMQAPGAGGSRFDQARAVARRSTDNLHAGQRMALVSAGSVNRIACGLTGDRNRLYAALEAIRPTDGMADLPAAVALAKDVILDSQRGRIIVATDRAATAPDESGVAAGVDWVVCGDSAENVGITRCEIRPRPSNPGDMEMLIEVFNAGTRAARCPLEVDFRGAPIDRSTLDIGPRQSVRRIRPIDDPAGGLLSARLIHADALPADNVAAVQVSERRRTRVALITPGNRAVEAALTSLPGIDITVASAADAAAPPADVVVWDGNVPARLPMGPQIVLAPTAKCDLWTLGNVAAGSAVVLDQIELSPVAHLDFTQAVLEDPIRLDFKLPGAQAGRQRGWRCNLQLAGARVGRCACVARADRQDRSGRTGDAAGLVCRRLALIRPERGTLRARRHHGRHGFDSAHRSGPPPAAGQRFARR